MFWIDTPILHMHISILYLSRFIEFDWSRKRLAMTRENQENNQVWIEEMVCNFWKRELPVVEKRAFYTRSIVPSYNKVKNRAFHLMLKWSWWLIIPCKSGHWHVQPEIPGCSFWAPKRTLLTSIPRALTFKAQTYTSIYPYWMRLEWWEKISRQVTITHDK